MQVQIKTEEELLASGWVYDEKDEHFDHPKDENICITNKMIKFFGQTVEVKESASLLLLEDDVEDLVWYISARMLVTESEVLKRIIRKLQ